MKKSIFLFFAAILCATSAWGKTIYLKPSSNWKEANAWFQVWDGKSNVTFESTGIDGLYKADISDQHDQDIYIKRKEPNTDNTWAESKVQVSTFNHFSNSGWNTTMTRSNIIGIVTGGHIYFDNAETNWTGNIQFVVGHDSYSRTYEMTQIADTKLWYVNLSDKSNHTWGDAKYYGFIASGSKFGDGNWNSSNLKNATSYTKAYTSTYSLNDGAIYYCKMSATANGSTFSIDYKSSKDDIQKYDATQAAKVRNSRTVAYTNVTNTWPATLTLEGTYLKTNSTTERTLITSTTSTDDANKRVYGAVTSGKITHTYSNLNDDYHFEGWGTGDAPTSTNASYEYNITANTTVYAFFTKKYAVNFSADANGSVAATADEQALTSGNKVVGGTTVTLTATANDGYEFVNWTKAGVEVSTEATYSLTVTENVDLVANFEKILIEIGDGDNSEVLNTYKNQTVDVKVNRTFKANDGYYTICLPFDLPASKIGTAYQVTSITEHVADQGFYMVFDEVQNLEAGQPYLILPNDLTNPTFEDVTITYTDNGESVTASGAGINFVMVGVINGGGQTEVGQYWVGDNGYFYNGDGTGTTAKLGLRVLFNITDNAGTPVKIRARVVLGENAATSLDNITNGENTTIKVIENGQLIIIRDGEKFNAQGVRF